MNALSFAKKKCIVSKREFARVVKTPFERAFSISNIKSGFAKCGIHPYDPRAIDESKLAPSLVHSSNLSTDESGSSTITCYPGSGSSNVDLSSTLSIASSDESSFPTSACPSPIVSSLSSGTHDDGYCSPQVLSQSSIRTSTPVSSAALDQTSPPTSNPAQSTAVGQSSPPTPVPVLSTAVGQSTPPTSSLVSSTAVGQSTPPTSSLVSSTAVGQSTPPTSSLVSSTAVG